MSQEHTPLPWHVVGHTVCIRQRGGQHNRYYDQPIANCDFFSTPAAANAEFIVRACNTHVDLLTACKAARHALLSYVYDNAAPDLAQEIADHLTALLTQIEGVAPNP